MLLQKRKQMEDYPSNSQRAKPASKPRVIEPVVTGNIIRKKKSPGKRLRNLLISGDPKEQATAVFLTVVIPSVKDLALNALQEYMFGVAHGGGSGVPNRGFARVMNDANFGRINYQRMSTKSPLIDRSEPRTRAGTTTQDAFDFDDIIFNDRVKAVTVLERLNDLVSQFDSATVRDLHDLVGITGPFTDEKYGWTNLSNASVSRVSEGYLLNLPRPEWLKD